MSHSLDARPRQREAIVTRRVVDETILVPIQRQIGEQHCIYTLNEVGEWIWERADGTRTIRELIAGVLESFDTTPDRARADVLQFVDSLTNEELLIIES